VSPQLAQERQERGVTILSVLVTGKKKGAGREDNHRREFVPRLFRRERSLKWVHVSGREGGKKCGGDQTLRREGREKKVEKKLLLLH